MQKMYRALAYDMWHNVRAIGWERSTEKEAEKDIRDAVKQAEELTNGPCYGVIQIVYLPDDYRKKVFMNKDSSEKR